MSLILSLHGPFILVGKILPAAVIPAWHAPHSRSDSHTGGVDGKAQGAKHVIEEDAVLHAVASSTACVANDFLKEKLGF